MIATAIAGGGLWAAEPDPFGDLDGAVRQSPVPGSAGDPFADLGTARAPIQPPASLGQPADGSQRLVESSFLERLLTKEFAFKKEIMLEFSRSSEAAALPRATADGWYSRSSAGFEMFKRFSTDTATVAAFDVQVRLVRRDNFHAVANDAEGADRRGWFLEYHNLYWDFYNVLNPLLDDAARGNYAGAFNARVGRFYLPFGLNLQTDTHGTLLQLSNEQNFGSDRDWYAAFWGSINAELSYDLYYAVGSGYDVAFRGQMGLVGTRLRLSNKYLNEYGIEAGLSILRGQRLSPEAVIRSPAIAVNSPGDGIVDTFRHGGDLRWRRSIPTGSITVTAELSAGRDQPDQIFTQLYQAEYLTRNRKCGLSLQYRRFAEETLFIPAAQSSSNRRWKGEMIDSSIIGELTWYFRNDLGNANLEWVKLNLERQTETRMGAPATIITLQYYRYW